MYDSKSFCFTSPCRRGLFLCYCFFSLFVIYLQCGISLNKR